MHVTALQDRCIAKEGVVTRVRRHNAHLMEEQGQYKEAVRTLNKELKEVREKLVESGRQNEKLKEEMTVLEQRSQTAGADAVRDFQASQLFIDSCAGYYGTGFDDCLKQVASAFPTLDLSMITMDDGEDDASQPAAPVETDGVVVLAQPAANPAPVVVDVEDRQDDGNPADGAAP